MWNKESKTKSGPGRRKSLLAYLLVGLMAFKPRSQGHVLPPLPEPTPAKRVVPTLRPASPAPVTVSMVDYARVDSDFYLIRTNDLDRPLSVALGIVGSDLSLMKQMTTFVTFLPGERERLVSIRPIIENFFAPDQPVF